MPETIYASPDNGPGTAGTVTVPAADGGLQAARNLINGQPGVAA
jgi:hypothetical protein